MNDYKTLNQNTKWIYRHFTQINPNQITLCKTVEMIFFLFAMPPEKKPKAGVIIKTKAAATNIHAVSLELKVPVLFPVND